MKTQYQRLTTITRKAAHTATATSVLPRRMLSSPALSSTYQATGAMPIKKIAPFTVSLTSNLRR